MEYDSFRVIYIEPRFNTNPSGGKNLEIRGLKPYSSGHYIASSPVRACLIPIILCQSSSRPIGVSSTSSSKQARGKWNDIISIQKGSWSFSSIRIIFPSEINRQKLEPVLDSKFSWVSLLLDKGGANERGRETGVTLSPDAARAPARPPCHPSSLTRTLGGSKHWWGGCEGVVSKLHSSSCFLPDISDSAVPFPSSRRCSWYESQNGSDRQMCQLWI